MGSVAGLCCVVGRAVDVLAPLRDVAIHVEESPRVGLFLADRVRLLLAVVGVPPYCREVVGGAEVVGRPRAGAGGIFPLGLGRKAVAVGGEVAVPVGRLLVVAGRQALQREIARCNRPWRRASERARPAPLGLSCQCEGSGSCDLLEHLVGHRNLIHEKRRLTVTLCGGASSGLPSLAPIVNSPPGSDDHVDAGLGLDEARRSRGHGTGGRCAVALPELSAFGWSASGREDNRIANARDKRVGWRSNNLVTGPILPGRRRRTRPALCCCCRQWSVGSRPRRLPCARSNMRGCSAEAA